MVIIRWSHEMSVSVDRVSTLSHCHHHFICSPQFLHNTRIESRSTEVLINLSRRTALRLSRGNRIYQIKKEAFTGVLASYNPWIGLSPNPPWKHSSDEIAILLVQEVHELGDLIYPQLSRTINSW